MSEDDSSSNDENNPEENSIKFNENFIIKLTNGTKITDTNAKRTCKILQISSQLNIDQKLTIIGTLEPSEYPNLFIFIIEHQNENFLNENQGTKAQQLDEHLKKFGAARPLIIQQTCEAENETKFYYKEEKSPQIVDIDQHYAENYELHEKMQNILRELDGRELQPREDQLLKKLSYIENFSIILRFLRTLSLPEIVFEILVRIVADSGSKADLLAILDASFEDNGRMLNDQTQNYIKKVIEDDESGSESDEVESDFEQSSDDDQDENGTSSQSKNEDSSQSVLLTAVQNSNHEIIDYLITYCTPLIQQLPVKHQIRISTAAFDTSQLDALCDLLEISDFPFPDGLNVTNDQVSHERLQQIITDRIKLHEAIEQENYKEINDFIENNLSLKFIYSPINITAMKKAIDTKKYKIYYYLKSFGLCATEFRNLGEVLDETELSRANDQANVQKTESISDALHHASKSVLILCTRSLIHNRKVKKEDETKYRKCIKKWLEDISKIAGIMLDVAASCENLVIIFDFESKYVDRTAFRDNTLGLSSDTVSSRIFIGANLGDNKREQEIKGVLAHEVCHYVMSLVYDNKFLSYYKHATDIRDWFDGIVKSIDKWSTNDQESPDDGCDGIISSVFTSYPVSCFHLELIVRAVHILVLYDDDPKHSAYLQEKYQILFDFWFALVLPELHKYLQKNKVVIRVNTTVELLSSLAKSKIELKTSKDMEQLTKNRIIIVTTNVPMLLFISMYSHLEKNCGCLLDSQNVFLEPEKIKNTQVWKDLMHLYAKDVKINIFVDCTKEKVNNLISILNIEEFNFILVASNEEHLTRLNDICAKKEIKPTIVYLKYNWSDLTEESQKILIQSTVRFQNNSKISLMELLSKNTNPDQSEVEKTLFDFSKIINDQLFNLLMDSQEISINSNIKDHNKNNSEILFRNRNFLKKGINFKNEISQEKLISITANNKYVLISDIAGSGKSWVVKNITKIIMKQDPTRWVTYVDLKQFIEEFRKEQPKNLEFTNYFIGNILKSKTKFEEEIFKKLYKNGKVLIIFDAFDEIAPDCAEFVANLAKLFEFNDGNQLWIVTRDYFEVNLQQKLEINNVYMLNEFSEEDGVKFIVASWILMDFKDQPIKDFENCLQNSSNLTKYLEKAKRIVQKVTMSKNQSIGLPQLFSMIADGFKDDKELLDDLKRSKIYTQFVNAMYTRWTDFKGILRKQASVQSQHYDVKFMDLHQYCAILSLFPELVDILFPDYDISEWPEVEIIAGGILNKIGSNYSFNHETFREYFIAAFIFKAIKKQKIKKAVFDVLIEILTVQKFGIIRMFLNDFIDISSIMDKVQLELEKSVEKFNNMENLSEYFTENLEQLAKCVVEVLKKGDYENVKKIISDNISAVVTNIKELKMFSTFTEFLFSFLKNEDLKVIINSQNVLHKMIGSDSDIETFEYFVIKLEEKAGREFIQQELKLMPSGTENGNIFYHLGSLQNLSEHKVQKCFEIFKKYLVDSEIVELMDKCNQDGQTIIHILFINTMNFKPFLDGADCLFTNQNLFQKFKNIVCETDWYDQNIFHWSANKEDINFHRSLWKLIQKTCENHEELRTLVLQNNKSQNNFLHLLVVNNKADVIEFTFLKLKENLNESDYHVILRSKGQFGRNLLQYAAARSKEAKNHQILWLTVRESCKSDDEFLDILEDFDNHGDNVLNIAATFTTSKIFDFMEKELEKIASPDKIRIFLINLGFGRKNLLQAAAVQNKSLEFNQTIWKIIHKYFNFSEILELIQHNDINGKNLLINVTENNTKEIIELAWNEAKELLIDSNDLIIEKHKESIQKCEKIIKNISEPNQLKSDEKEILKLKWIKNKHSEASKLFDKEIQRLVEQNLNNIKFENLKFFIADENVENHEKLWESLVKIHTNSEDLKKLLSEKNESGNNFIHLLVIYNTAEVIEFTINKFKEVLSESDYQEILRSKGQLGRNLLQLAAVASKEVKTHQILWKSLQKSCKSNQEFLKIHGEVDNYGNDVFNLAASFTTGQVFEFMKEELDKIASRNEIRKLFIKLGQGNRNLLQAAAEGNKSLEFHKTLWKIIQKYFNLSEILEFVKHLDVNGDNLLIITKEWNTKEILELTWIEVEKVLSDLYSDTETVQKIEECKKIVQKIVEFKNKNDELLKLDWIKNANSESSNLFDTFIQNILRNDLTVHTLDDLMPIITNKNDLNHEIFWDHLLKTFENRQDLAKILLEKNQNGDNFIHRLVILNKSNVIEFTLNKLKENLSESDFYKILRSKGQLERSLLENAAVASKEVKTYQILWKALQESCKSGEEFLKILEESCDNVFGLAATFTTGEIFKFMQNELEKIASRDEIRKLLINLGFGRQNLMQQAAQQNESLELQEALWEIIEKYFNSSEILHFIKHRDVYGKNVLLNAIIGNTKEVKELTWNIIKNIIGYENNDNFKKCDEIMKKDKDFLDLTKEEKEILKLDWIENKNSFKLFKDNIQLLMEKPISDISLEDLMLFMADENIENHGCLWKYLEESFKSYKNLKKLLFEMDKNGNSFIHLLVILNTADVINFTLNKFKETLNESDYQEILRSKGQANRNLLQYAAIASKEVKTHQILWKAFQNSCKSNEEFLDILKEVDVHENNIFHLAAALTTSEVFEFMISEIEKLTNDKEIIRKLLSSFGQENTILLQFIAVNNKSLETNKSVWKLISKYFEFNEIITLIEHCNVYGDNILCCAVLWNTTGIVEFTWNQIKIFINTKDAQVEYLNRKGRKNKSLYQLSLENQRNHSHVADLVQKIMHEYGILCPE